MSDTEHADADHDDRQTVVHENIEFPNAVADTCSNCKPGLFAASFYLIGLFRSGYLLHPNCILSN